MTRKSSSAKINGPIHLPTYILPSRLHRQENVGKINLSFTRVQFETCVGENDSVQLENAFGCMG